jgi:hypothetical protein
MVLMPLAESRAAEHDQTIALRAGWNSVFLRVDPALAQPSELFKDLPVEIVAGFYPSQTPVYFPRDPGSHSWQEEDWRVWYASSRPEAFLSNLHSISSHRGYLIYASADFTWQVTGEVQFRPIRWEPDALNLAGFSVSSERPPTFAAFFAGSRAHSGKRFFQLVEGKWTLIRDPASTRMRAGEAYWIESSGASDFQGPLQARLPVQGALDFGPSIPSLSVSISNKGTGPRQVQASFHPSVGNLVLSRLVTDLTTLSSRYSGLGSSLSMGTLAAGENREIRLAPHRELMTQGHASGLLQLSDSDGSELWIPIRSTRSSNVQ